MIVHKSSSLFLSSHLVHCNSVSVPMAYTLSFNWSNFKPVLCVRFPSVLNMNPFASLLVKGKHTRSPLVFYCMLNDNVTIMLVGRIHLPKNTLLYYSPSSSPSPSTLSCIFFFLTASLDLSFFFPLFQMSFSYPRL